MSRSVIRRRALLVGAAAVLGLGWWLAPRVRRSLVPDFDFAPLASPPGFRRIAAGAVSSGLDPLAGLNRGAAGDGAMAAAVRADPCTALFGPLPVPPGTVPIASFSDYRCPYCRILTALLAAIEAASPDTVRVTWHEWPLLGEASETAARAALAARRQDGYLAMHVRLMRSGFLPTPAYLDVVATEIGLDPARLRADMAGDAVARDIAESRALAGLFGFAGTPALVVGRTVVVGAIDAPTLQALIARERADGAGRCRST